jgi:hypothetical protein
MEKDIKKLIVTDFKQRHLTVSQNAFDRLMDKKILSASKRRLRFYKIIAVAAGVLLFVLALSFQWQKSKIPNTTTEIKNQPKSIKGHAPSQNIDKILKKERFLVAESRHHLIRQLPVFKIVQVAHSNSVLNQSPKVDVFRNPHLKFVDKALRISDSELDALLTSATAQLKDISSDSLKVNALQMLYEIEIEINKPLPEKIIITLKSGSKTLKDIINPKDN